MAKEPNNTIDESNKKTNNLLDPERWKMVIKKINAEISNHKVSLPKDMPNADIKLIRQEIIKAIALNSFNLEQSALDEEINILVKSLTEYAVFPLPEKEGIFPNIVMWLRKLRMAKERKFLKNIISQVKNNY